MKVNNALILGGYVFLSFTSFFSKLKKTDVIIIYIFFFILLTLPHILAIILNPKSSLLDTSDILRNLSFLFFFILGVSSNTFQLNFTFDVILKFIIVILFALLIISFVWRDQFDNIEMFFGKIDNVVGARFFIPFYNPYDLGIFLLLPFIFFLIIKKYFYFFISFLLIIGTQSRTAIALILLVFLLSLIYIKKTRKFVMFFLLFCFILLFFLYNYLELTEFSKFYLLDNTQKLLMGESTTLTKRFDQWENLQNFNLLGFGVIHTDEIMIENGFLYEIMKFGFFSIFTIIFFYFIPLLLSIIYIIKAKILNPIYMTLAFWIICFFIATNTNVFLYQVKLSFIYWFFLGVFVQNFKFDLNE